MKNSTYTIQMSTIQAELSGLLLLLERTNRLHLLGEIQNKLPDFEAIADNNDRIPLNFVSDAMNTVAAITQEPNLGLKITSLVELEDIPLYKAIQLPISSLITDSDKIPLHILLNLLVRYYKVITEDVSIDVEEYPDKIIIKLIPNMPDSITLHHIEAIALGICRIINELNRLKACRIQFCHAQPSDDLAIYQDTFKIIPEFNQDIDSLEFPIPNNERDHGDQLYNLMSALQNLMNVEFPQASFSEQCQHVLKCILSLGEPKRECVAKVLNLSISSLKRRLKEEGTSFHAVLLASRKRLVHEYLITQKRSVNDTAFLLGYQSNIQFRNAFKKWFGLTPHQYRKRGGFINL